MQCGTSVPSLSACEIETHLSFTLFFVCPPFLDLSDLVGIAIRPCSYLAPVGLRSLGEALCSDHFTHPWFDFFPECCGWNKVGRSWFLVPDSTLLWKIHNPLAPLTSFSPTSALSLTDKTFL
jgi:hypothetical protein